MELDISSLSLDDLDQCLQLSNEEAGWNQNAADWTFILEEGATFGIKRDGHLLASAGVIPYGQKFGWICMVLVKAAERRQGFALRLLKACVEWLTKRGMIAGLDATQAGREVYRQIGFRDVYTITRFHHACLSPRRKAIAFAHIEPLTPASIEDVGSYDRHYFGEDRSQLLKRWLLRKPHSAFMMTGANHVRGFLLAREGRNASHIGPAVADDEASAIALLGAALNTIEGPAIVDVPDHHAQLHEWLKEQGFSPQRKFIRMLLNRTEPLDRPEKIVAVTGAEFG